jgi:tetratricopeptide (TPR) repeat protein
MIHYLNPLNWFRWTGQFVYCWVVSIPWRSVSAGAPAIGLTLGLMLLTFLAYSDGGSWRQNILTEQLDAAFQTEDFDTAELLIQRRIDGGDESGGTFFKLAVAQFQQGEEEKATALMRQLASRQNGPAAMWLVKELYLGKSWTDLDREQQTEFGRLLALLAQQQPNDLGIIQLYADYLIASERLAAAIPYLRQLTEKQPMRGWQAAALARRTGDEPLAVRLAKETLARVEGLFQEEPANPNLALAVVQNQIFLDQHAEAVRLLNDALSRMKTDEHRQVLQQAMGDTISAWIVKIQQQPNNSLAEKLQVLKLLQVALQYAPNNPRVLTLVADQVLKTIDSSDEEVITVRNALVRGTSPGIAHFVRGTAALIKGDAESAQRHLTLASQHLPNSGAILNNLAVALSQRDDADLQQALQLSEQAIATVTQPGPYLYETRGQILFRMKRFLDAIPDFERALAANELAGAAHEKLASCYRELNEPALADEHQAAAEQIKTQTSAE